MTQNRGKAVISHREDIETFDFIISLINAYSNCDSWGYSDMFEKHEMCDRALSFLHKNIKIKNN